MRELDIPELSISDVGDEAVIARKYSMAETDFTTGTVLQGNFRDGSAEIVVQQTTQTHMPDSLPGCGRKIAGYETNEACREAMLQQKIEYVGLIRFRLAQTVA